MIFQRRVSVGGALSAAVVLAALSATGCNTEPNFIGNWTTDRSKLIGSPSGDNDLANLLAPGPKFSVSFTNDGKCSSSWTGEDGKEQSRSGTWKMVEDQGLKWRITMKVAPDEEEWGVKVGSPDNNTISLEAEDAFKKGGPIFFKRR
ncbi:MAG TPA: hypothetical protein VFB96_02805 [Pirellulaceae bacterium]|nr:hypothetical protein [Pirellulaceae bacterium]